MGKYSFVVLLLIACDSRPLLYNDADAHSVNPTNINIQDGGRCKELPGDNGLSAIECPTLLTRKCWSIPSMTQLINCTVASDVPCIQECQ